MRWAFVGLLVIHGLIHFMGFAKAFGLADLPQLTQPISKPLGIVWLAAGLLVLLTATTILSAAHSWWVAGLGALLLSQAVIIGSWTDAMYGTVANALLLTGVIYGIAAEGPASLRAEYRREVDARLSRPFSPAPITEPDLEHLPEPVQRYLQVTGAVSQPRVHHVKASWQGRIRLSATHPWMSFRAVQHNFVDEPSRFFLMGATRSGLPVDVLHVFRDQAASMRVRLVSLFPLVDAAGPEPTRAETVTLFNDLCLLAPGALIDPSIRWASIDQRSARGYYTVGANTISAVLSFNEAGELVDFVSDDRLVASPDGTTFSAQRWSTPVSDYQSFGGLRAATRGEGRWHPPDGEFAYIELELLTLEVNGKTL